VLQGNTSPGRLRLLDESLILGLMNFPQTACDKSDTGEVDFPRVTVVDLGLGDSPSTTLEFAVALKNVCSMSTIASPLEPKIIGVEVDNDRLERCIRLLQDASYSGLLQNTPPIELRLGGTSFVLPLIESEPRPSMIRAMNVLRSYGIPHAIKGLRTLFQQLCHEGGTLVEGSAEAGGKVMVAMVLKRSKMNLTYHVENGDASSSDDEVELGIDAVIFAADLDAIATDPELNMLSAHSWFNRHNHLPRLWRGFCDVEECSDEDVPRWALPVREFLRTWEKACSCVLPITPSVQERLHEIMDQGTNCPRSVTVTAAQTSSSKICWTEQDSTTSLRDKFVLGAEELARGIKSDNSSLDSRSPCVKTDWASKGIVVWYPGLDPTSGTPALLVPDIEEYYWWEERIGRRVL